MSDAHRDDLEAALVRASELDREVEELRRRNAELEAGGQTDEARENARRLAAAIEREQKEAQIRDERKLDEASWHEAQIRQQRELVARPPPAVATPPPLVPEPIQQAIAIAGVCAGALVALIALVWCYPVLGGGLVVVLVAFGMLFVRR